jgi:hypothetical protein
MKQWTDEVDREAETFFATLTETEMRRRQDLCAQQIAIAHRERKGDALDDLRRMESALVREMLRRCSR